MTKLEDEILQFQLTTNADIPTHVWESTAVAMDKDSGTKHYRMDVLWAYINTIKSLDGAFSFKRLASVALLVLALSRGRKGLYHGYKEQN